MIDPIVTRLHDLVPDLGGRVKGALEMAALVASGSVPPKTPAAFVIPGTINGGSVMAATGAFIQATEDVIQVVLALRSHEPTGQRGADPLKALIDAVLAALCGWTPDQNCPGPLKLVRAGLVSMTSGLVIYQIDLSVSTQLRIAR